MIFTVSKVRRLVLDVLKPHQPTMLTLADKLGDIDGIEGVDIALFEIDNKVENIKITLEGDDRGDPCAPRARGRPFFAAPV